MGTGDVLHNTVYGQPDLTTDARVSETGTITFPLLGDVKMADITPAQGETEIAQRLSKSGTITFPLIVDVKMADITPAQDKTKNTQRQSKDNNNNKPNDTHNVVQY